MRVVGLTGGIATGKSTVSDTIQREGIDVVDCDKIAHAVVKKGRWGHKRVVRAFGTTVLQSNGELDRAALGNIIFKDANARKKLNKFVDMPLLFETGSDKWFGERVLVACDSGTQIERLMKRDSCTRETAEAKVSSQMPLDGKRKKASYVIENDGSREDTVVKTKKLVEALGRKATLSGMLFSPVFLVAVTAGLWLLLASKFRQ